MFIPIPTEEQIIERQRRSIDKNDSFLMVPDSVNPKNPGFVHPSNIDGYYCSECKDYFEGPPSGIEVYIHDDFGDGEQLRAHVHYSHTVKTDDADCKHDLCYFDVPVSELGKIPVEFIEYDGTGDYKTPTPEAIEKVFTYAEEIAARGDGPDLEHTPCFAQLILIRRWARKIGYKVDEERLESLRKEIYQKAYIENFQKGLPDFIRKLQLNAHDVQLKQMLEVLPYLELGDGMKESIAEIFKSNYDSKEDKLKLLEEEKSELEEKINKVEEQLHEAKLLLDEASDKLK